MFAVVFGLYAASLERSYSRCSCPCGTDIKFLAQYDFSADESLFHCMHDLDLLKLTQTRTAHGAIKYFTGIDVRAPPCARAKATAACITGRTYSACEGRYHSQNNTS